MSLFSPRKTMKIACMELVVVLSSIVVAEDLTPMAWAEGNLTVPRGCSVTVNGGEKHNTALTISGAVTVNMDATSTKYYVYGGTPEAPVNSSIVLAPNDGDDALLTIIRGSMWGRYNNSMYSPLYFGTASVKSKARLVVGPKCSSEVDFSSLEFRAGLQPQNADDDVIDAVTIDHGATLWAWRMVQNNSKPVRVTFTNSLGTAANSSRGMFRGFYNGDMFRCCVPGGDIVLRGSGYYDKGVTNAPIVLSTHGGNTSSVYKKLFADGDSYRRACIRTEGDCDFVFDPASAGGAATYPVWHDFNATNFIWNHTGDFIVPNTGYYNVGIRTSVSGVLPHGPQTGIVRVNANAASAQKQFIDIYGTTQSVNGLMLTGGAQLTNLSAKAALLLLGEGDVNATLSTGTGVAPSVAFRKVGTGTLTMSGSSTLAKLNVEEGELHVKGSATVSDLAVATGPIMLETGASLVCDTLAYTGRVSVADGAALTIMDRSHTQIEGYDLAVADVQPKVAPFGYCKSCTYMLEPFSKTGASLASITVDRAPTGPIAVDAGTLRVVQPACTDKYWRFVFKKTSGTATQYGSSAPYRQADGAVPMKVHLVLGKLHLLDADGAIANLSSSYKGTVADTALVPGSHAFTHDFFNTRNVQYGAGAEWNNGAYVAMDMGSWWSATAFTNQPLVVDNPATWETITFRLKDTANGIAGYMLSEGSNAAREYGDPRTWTLESSKDVATVAAGTWTVRDARTDEVLTHYGTANMDYFNSNRPFLLNQRTMGGFAFTNAVSVAAGATLDLAALDPADVAVPKLTVDLSAGGGTLVNVAPAANGVIDLRNVPSASRTPDGHLRSQIAVPLTFTNPSATANFAGWTVTVDGAPAPASSVVWTGTGLKVLTANGTMVIFR